MDILIGKSVGTVKNGMILIIQICTYLKVILGIEVVDGWKKVIDDEIDIGLSLYMPQS